MRLFVAIELPAAVKDELERISCGLPRARWVPADQRHLTLSFIGEVDGAELDNIIASLETVRALAFPLQLAGAGCFPPRRDPRVLWVGIEKSDPLNELKKKIDRALNRAGITPDSRKFFPHITLARVARTPIGRTARFLAEHSGFALPPFEVTSFLLFSSRLTPDGAIHHPEAEFLLNE
jgi:2'-5' RNA ligase